MRSKRSDPTTAVNPTEIFKYVFDGRCPQRETLQYVHEVGLRATACVRLLRAGANTRQIADLVGMFEGIVGRYCRFSVQRENASAAVLHLDRTFRERNPAKRENGGS